MEPLIFTLSCSYFQTHMKALTLSHMHTHTHIHTHKDLSHFDLDNGHPPPSQNTWCNVTRSKLFEDYTEVFEKYGIFGLSHIFSYFVTFAFCVLLLFSISVYSNQLLLFLNWLFSLFFLLTKLLLFIIKLKKQNSK